VLIAYDQKIVREGAGHADRAWAGRITSSGRGDRRRTTPSGQALELNLTSSMDLNMPTVNGCPRATERLRSLRRPSWSWF